MGSVRLFILGFLLYIAWRLVLNLLITNKRVAEQPSESSSVKDILVEDPVCHTLLPKQQAVRLRHGDKTYYFCSEKCCDIFSRKLKTEEQENT
jgi:YHS domain-containing protein